VNFTKKHYQLVSTGINKTLSIDKQLISTVTNKKYDNDVLFDELADLVNNDFRAWYCGRFYKLGTQRVLELASIARADGREPKKLFSTLLKTPPQERH